MKNKTNKSFSKRLKITKSGKALSRKSGQNHFNAKESRKRQMRQKRLKTFDIPHKKLKHFLPSV